MPANSLIAFEENEIRYYTHQNNTLIFNEIKDIALDKSRLIAYIGALREETMQQIDRALEASLGFQEDD